MWVLFALLCVSCSPAHEQKSTDPVQEQSVVAKQDPVEQQLVRLHIPLSGALPTKKESDQYAKLEDDLNVAAKKAGVGKLDGNEVGDREYTIWMYGRDATKLAEVVKSVVKGRALPKGCKLFLQHGGVDDSTTKHETIALGN